MPLMIREIHIETRQTRLEDRQTGEADRLEPEGTERDECSCDACQAASRDEMWIRWA